MDDLLFLIVTANQNETDALLNSSLFKYHEERAKNDSTDNAFYNVGKYGNYKVVHTQLNEQAVAKSDSAILAVNAAINNYHPDAVIMVGVAFGKDSEKQKIGEVLISEKVADYESGKIENGVLKSDGVIAESGRQLQATFKHYADRWAKANKDTNAMYEVGMILSGDKVCNDSEFKKVLLERYPRAIGGEMEGRGVYAVCRRNNINEWIIVKGICDWGENKEDNKEENQKKAAQSAVSLLDYLFADKESFCQVEKMNYSRNANNSSKSENTQDIKTNEKKDVCLGYVINFGVTTCRLYAIFKGKQGLKENKVISYDISDPLNPEYYSNIIEQVNNQIMPELKKAGEQIFVKAFADVEFENLLKDITKRNNFIYDLYFKTGLYFNIVTQKQTEENMKRLFKYVKASSVVIDIGSRNIQMLVKDNKKVYSMITIDFLLKDIENYISRHGISEKWNEEDIKNIKKYILDEFGDKIKKLKIKNAIIIKNELDFMTEIGYPLRTEDGAQCISMNEYKFANRERLFNVDFKTITEASEESSAGEKNKLYGFKLGHIVLETIFETIGVERIIPSNEISLHGNELAYIFNVVISGSTHGEHAKDMEEAVRTMHKRGITVLSPQCPRGRLCKITKDTQRKHDNAIRECDLLFVCNKSGYLGAQTKREIYGAYLLNKPIGFWKNPEWPSDDNALDYIPSEDWWDLMRVLEDEEDK